MNVFDFNIHLPYEVNPDVNSVIDNDLNLDIEGLNKGLELNKSLLGELEGANFLLFNTDLFSQSIELFTPAAQKLVDHVSLTALIDFRRNDLHEYLEQVNSQGGRAIMFNSYLQQISDSDFPKVLEACKFAEANNTIVCIDGSYGTSKMYEYDNLKLACYIADHITKVPIVIVHSGGLRIKEAMLLALDKSNIWLDTSFSLPYYIGSSIEMDYAFAYKKIGLERIVYGSDTPYLNSENAQQIHLEFFQKFNFSDNDVENIMCNNALNLING